MFQMRLGRSFMNFSFPARIIESFTERTTNLEAGTPELPFQLQLQLSPFPRSCIVSSTSAPHARLTHYSRGHPINYLSTHMNARSRLKSIILLLQQWCALAILPLLVTSANLFPLQYVQCIILIVGVEYSF